MSRILLVKDDPRSLPCSELHWWRHKLKPNSDLIYHVTSVDLIEVDPKYGKESVDYGAWSGYIDYFDGRNDWSFPYKLRYKPVYESREIRPGQFYTVPQLKGMGIDILSRTPPNFETWSHLRRGVRHPDDDPPSW